MAVYFLFYYHYHSEKIRLDCSYGSSARQMIHVNYQALFSLKSTKKYFKMPFAAAVIGALKLNHTYAYEQPLPGSFSSCLQILDSILNSAAINKIDDVDIEN